MQISNSSYVNPLRAECIPRKHEIIWADDGIMLAHRLRRWRSIITASWRTAQKPLVNHQWHAGGSQRGFATDGD